MAINKRKHLPASKLTDIRSNKAIAVSGCLLHQSLMAKGCETAPSMIKPVINWALDNEIGLIPWTCPETLLAGLPRTPKGIEGYRKLGLEEFSQIRIADSFSYYLHAQVKGGIDILGIVGVSFSPACSASRQAYHKNEKGLFIAALEKSLKLRGVTIPIIDIHRKKTDETIIDVLNTLLE